jgi:serine/threonine-protein kinase
MSLPAGARLGGYEVVGLIGAGGMGEVYRAHDARLNRDVALKILPDLFATDPERLARFEREAQALAALNHPHIAQIYGVVDGTSDAGVAPVRALVMELVEGEPLSQRIATGPLAIEEALAIAGQIADALDAAHGQGVIHRDLKPANVTMRADGTVKVLDFGLAKLESGADGSSVMGATLSPTISVAFTGAGVILGTAAYMAPEQARGRAVDKRVDIWAFGCILVETLTGTKAFDGADATEMIAAVVRGEPDWAALPAAVPSHVRALLRRCLEKDPKHRLRDIGDARFELRAATALPETPASAAGSRRPRVAWSTIAAGVLVIAVAAAAAGYAAWRLKPDPPRAIARFAITLPADQQFSFAGRHMIAISPSGTYIAYSANNELYLRRLDQLDAVPIRGTSGGGRSPFFSADGQWLGFWHDGSLKKVSVSGGAPVVICAADNPWGASWGPDNMILVGQGPNGIVRVSGDGGKTETLIRMKSPESAHGPQLLPDGRNVLFTLASNPVGTWNDATIVVQSLDTGARKTLIRGGTDARYVDSGHIVYALNGSVLAVPFDIKKLEVIGGPVPLVENVAEASAGVTGALHYGVSRNGTLVYIPAGGVTAVQRTLAWLDRSGTETPINTPTRLFRYPRISPDDQRLTLDIPDENRDIWVWNFKGETLTRLTLESSQEQYGVWTPDGRRVIYASSMAGPANLYWQNSDGTGRAERLTTSLNPQFPQTVSPDGTTLVFREQVTSSNSDLMMVTLQGERRPKPLMATSFNEVNAELSPDGKWLAYQSDESGRDEIYVRPFPNIGEGRWQLSTNGGTRPLWSRDGKELFYVSRTLNLMTIPVQASTGFSASSPTKVVDAQLVETGPGRMYDVSTDGRRFLIIKPSASANAKTAPPSITLVQNWVDELTRRVQPR